ncbi:MAG: hypothetical protein M1831_005613 [Alyxoria varia]|nr:MAG: hypothetical protein M1831_005613 [Alyxoria varia]
MTPGLINPQTVQGNGLSTEELDSWDRNGYLIIPDALSPDMVKTLLHESRGMLHDFSLEDHPMTKFSTGEGGNEHIGDDYFLTSGEKVRFFFEEGAFDASGNLVKPKHLAINKIGHYLHELSPSFRQISLSPRNGAIAKSVGFKDPRVLQSMIICKQPEIGGEVKSHQDSTFLYTKPPSAVGFWYALEDATISNGTLSFAKGTHKSHPITKRLVRQDPSGPNSGGTGFIPVDGPTFPAQHVLRDESSEEHKDPEFTLEEVKAGSLVLIHGNVLHQSEQNTSSTSRFIYTFHMIEGENEYDDRNWLQPPHQGFSKFVMEGG